MDYKYQLESRLADIKKERSQVKAKANDYLDVLDQMHSRCAELTDQECEDYIQLSDELEELLDQLDTLKVKRKRAKRRLRQANKNSISQVMGAFANLSICSSPVAPAHLNVFVEQLVQAAGGTADEDSVVESALAQEDLVSIQELVSGMEGLTVQERAQEQQPADGFKYECPICKEKFKVNRHKTCGPVTLVALQNQLQ